MSGLVKIVDIFLTGLFDILVWPFKSLAPIWPILFISFVAGIIMLWIFGKVSNQDAIKRIRDRIRGNLIGVRLFQDDIGVLLRLQGTILIDTLRYMKHSLVPMLIMIVPVLLIMIQLNLRFSVRPLAPDETTVLKVRVRDASALRGGLVLDASPGFTVETPPVRIPSEREVAWRIRAGKAGRYTVKVRLGDEVVEKELVVGDGWASVSPLRTGGGITENLLYPGESPLLPSLMIESVTVNYPNLDVTIFGFAIHWLVLFFALSIAFGFAFKGVLGVEV